MKKCTIELQIIIKGGNSILLLKLRFNKKWNKVIRSCDFVYMSRGSIFCFPEFNVMVYSVYTFSLFASNNLFKCINEVAKTLITCVKLTKFKSSQFPYI